MAAIIFTTGVQFSIVMFSIAHETETQSFALSSPLSDFLYSVSIREGGGEFFPSSTQFLRLPFPLRSLVKKQQTKNQQKRNFNVYPLLHKKLDGWIKVDKIKSDLLFHLHALPMICKFPDTFVQFNSSQFKLY